MAQIVGIAIQTAAFIGTIIWFQAQMDKRVTILESMNLERARQIDEIKGVTKDLAATVNRQAIITERLVTIVEQLNKNP